MPLTISSRTEVEIPHGDSPEPFRKQYTAQICDCSTFVLSTEPVHNSISTPDHSKRKQKCLEQCYDDERSYLRQMSKRAWITALPLFGLFFRNSHATVFYKKRQTLQECSRLHFTIIVINVTSCLMANVETPLSCCGKWYIDIDMQNISLLHPRSLHDLIYIKASDSSTVISFLCCFQEQAALDVSSTKLPRAYLPPLLTPTSPTHRCWMHIRMESYCVERD